MPAMVISVEAVLVDIAILQDNWISEVVVEKPEIISTDPHILIDNNCKEDKLHSGMPGGCRDYEDEGDKRYERDPIPTASLQGWAATELERFDQGSSDVNGYAGKDGNNEDAEEEQEASQANDGSTQNVEA